MPKNKKIYKKEENSIEKTLPEVVEPMNPAALPGNELSKLAVEKIQAASTQAELDAGIALFNLSQKKKNVTRALEYEDLLDKIVQQAKDRIEHRPAEFSNEDVLKYMTVMSTQLDRTNKIVNEVSDKPAIQISQQKTNVQINVLPNQPTRESRDRIMTALDAILKAVGNDASKLQDVAVQEQPEASEEELIVDVESTEHK